MADPGDVLGDFTIVREVGRGAMGVVYEARQESLARRVAVKVLHPAAALEPTFVARFREEAIGVARLSHEGILPVYAVGSVDDVPWFAMEFVEGEELGALVERDGPMDPRRAGRIVRDAALALSHAHEQGI